MAKIVQVMNSEVRCQVLLIAVTTITTKAQQPWAVVVNNPNPLPSPSSTNTTRSEELIRVLTRTILGAHLGRLQPVGILTIDLGHKRKLKF